MSTTLSRFLSQGAKDEWWRGTVGTVQENGIRAYMRLTFRGLGEKNARSGFPSLLRTVEIANVNVGEPYQRQGRFKKLLTRTERWADKNGRVVYIENVLNPYLLAWFEKHQEYRLVENSIPPCFYRPAQSVARKEE